MNDIRFTTEEILPKVGLEHLWITNWDADDVLVEALMVFSERVRERIATTYPDEVKGRELLGLAPFYNERDDEYKRIGIVTLPILDGRPQVKKF